MHAIMAELSHTQTALVASTATAASCQRCGLVVLSNSAASTASAAGLCAPSLRACARVATGIYTATRGEMTLEVADGRPW